MQLSFEVLSKDDAQKYFKPQIDAAILDGYVNWLNQFEVGDAVRIHIEKGTDAESAREVKKNLNAAASRHLKGVKSANGRAVITDQPEPVKLRFKADTHKETVTKNGKTKDVTIVDKLVVCLAATKPATTSAAPDAAPPASTPPASTPPEATANGTSTRQPAASRR